MGKVIFGLLLFVIIGCIPSIYEPKSLKIIIPQDRTEFQKMLISQISGASAIQDDKGEEIIINSRWNGHEKRLVESYLKGIFAQLGLEPKVHSYQLPNMHLAIDIIAEPLSGRNIYTILPATDDSHEYVVIGAHYDTGGKNIPGAIDNGSGMAVILGVLKEAINLKKRKRNLMVVFFDQEEEDISAGSTAFAQFLLDNYKSVHSVHSYDMIGWDGDNNKEVELEMPSPEIERSYQRYADSLNIPIYSTQINSSDHYSFIKRGINAVGISHAFAKGDNSGKKDTKEDTFDLVNFEYIESSTDLAYAVIKDLING